MERLILDDMIKALKCIASQDGEGDCYADHENFNHMEDDNYKRLVCRDGENLKDNISGREAVGCPYHQKKYGCCFEDGELYWLKDVAEFLEELKSYKDLEEQGLLVRLPCKVGDIVYDIFFGYPEAHMVKAISYGYFIGYIEPKIENEIIFYCENCTNTMRVMFPMRELDKTVFLTREEAEKKLEEIKNA